MHCTDERRKAARLLVLAGAESRLGVTEVRPWGGWRVTASERAIDEVSTRWWKKQILIEEKSTRVQTSDWRRSGCAWRVEEASEVCVVVGGGWVVAVVRDWV